MALFLKHRYTTQLGAAQANTRYIAFRSREVGERGAFDAQGDHADVGGFASRLADPLTKHAKVAKAHKVVVSLGRAEFSLCGWKNWRPVIREAIASYERRTGRRLDWIAAEHQSADHPHVHLLIKATYQDRQGRAHRLRLTRADHRELRLDVERVLLRERSLAEALDRVATEQLLRDDTREVIWAVRQALRRAQTEVDQITGAGAAKQPPMSPELYRELQPVFNQVGPRLPVPGHKRGGPRPPRSGQTAVALSGTERSLLHNASLALLNQPGVAERYHRLHPWVQGRIRGQLEDRILGSAARHAEETLKRQTRALAWLRLRELRREPRWGDRLSPGEREGLGASLHTLRLGLQPSTGGQAGEPELAALAAARDVLAGDAELQQIAAQYDPSFQAVIACEIELVTLRAAKAQAPSRSAPRRQSAGQLTADLVRELFGKLDQVEHEREATRIREQDRVTRGRGGRSR